MILRTLVIGAWLFAFGSLGLSAQNLAPAASPVSEAELQELGQSLQLNSLIARMRQEGLDSAPDLARDFGIQRPTALIEQFDRLFDATAMEGLILAELQRELQAMPMCGRKPSSSFPGLWGPGFWRPRLTPGPPSKTPRPNRRPRSAMIRWPRMILSGAV